MVGAWVPGGATIAMMIGMERSRGKRIDALVSSNEPKVQNGSIAVALVSVRRADS